MLPFTRAMFIHGSNFQEVFEKGHSRKIPVKLFQNWTSGFRKKDFLRISSCLFSARSPIHQSHVYGLIKVLRTVL